LTGEKEGGLPEEGKEVVKLSDRKEKRVARGRRGPV